MPISTPVQSIWGWKDLVGLGEANKYFSVEEPWKLRKSDFQNRAHFRTVLYTTPEVVRIAALLTNR